MENSSVVFVFLTIAIIGAISFSNGNTDVLCRESERQALLRFKHDLKDPMNWLSTWDGEGDCCSWVGVTCDNLTGHILELHVNSLNLSSVFECDNPMGCGLGGKINPSLLDLRYLKCLDLSRNNFAGNRIPSFIGSLKSLTSLNLSYSGFEGKIPYQFGNLSNLRYLYLGDSYGLKAESLQWMSGLSLLQSVEMSFVDLSKTFDWLQVINMLPSLVELRLRGCELQNNFAPLSVINSTSLVTLDLSSNDLGPLMPMWIFSLSNLEHLDVGFNSFELGSISFGLKNLTRLKTLSMVWNSFNSTIPQWLFCLNRLEYLDLSVTKLKGKIPNAIGNLTSINFLDLSSNQLEGKIPNSFENFCKIKTLELSDNKLSGAFSGILRSLSTCAADSLESLHLYGNQLSGQLSASLGRLSNLQDFDVAYNQLTGSLPESLGQLVKLESLDLFQNLFTGSLPESLGQLVKLKSLDISLNLLNGSLPESLGQLVKLESLDLFHNLLTGSLPESLGQLVKLEFFTISHNLLNGSLPESLGQLMKLVFLDISNNLLKGMVSEVHFANLTKLKELDASGNSLALKTNPHWLPPFQLDNLNLNSWHLGLQPLHWIRSQQHLSELQISSSGISGTIPSWFCNFSHGLDYLNLSHNQFHGEFPCTNLSLSIMDLSSNQFNGSLPFVSLGSSGIRLHFSNNSFSGSVYHFFCDNSYSEPVYGSVYVDFGNNLLSGKIPNCWSKWKGLIVLNLQNNNLFGVIPSSMGYLTRLESLQLRNNSLHGKLPSSLQKCIDLRVLDLSENKFVGMIPKWIGISFSRLVILNLRSNRFQDDIPLELCNLMNLQILDLAQNNVSGTIPRCFYNLSSMSTLPYSESPSLTIGSAEYFRPSMNFLSADELYEIMAEVVVVTKGREAEYDTVLNLVRSMDLSSNNLYGQIPVELTSLQLQTLNLSKNNLAGKIPPKIGDMRRLESLDLSENQLSGEIPSSMSSLTFLSVLNLSYNKLTGPIPTGTQLQSFNESSFIGNQLCGPPLQQNCSVSDHDHDSPPAGSKQGEQAWLLEDKYFYLSLGLGFAFGFWCVLGSLLSNMPWSVAFRRFLDRIVLKLYSVMFEKYFM